MRMLFRVLWLLSACEVTFAWDSEELEIFDLVEEINENFYEFMEISMDATAREVRTAFRNLSIVLHPDKNPLEDTSVQFRNLVSIYEVLRDPSKREKYNKVLRDGLPNWKSALYYYRRMRKIGFYEGALIVFIITTVGQYLFAWAAYLEKKFTAEQVFGSKLRKLQKKNKNINMDAILNEIPLPSLLNTLPFQIPVAIWNLPANVKLMFHRANALKEIALEKRRLEAEEAKRQEELEKEFEEQQRLRKEKKELLRKRKQTSKAPEKTDADLQGYARIEVKEFNEGDAIKPVAHKPSTVSGGFWSDEDLSELVRLVKKYPIGTRNRWETIAEAMNRTVQEVTFMAAKMKENAYRVQGQSDSVAENIAQEAVARVKKEKTKKTSDNAGQMVDASWSQVQQRALEAALIKHKKTTIGDRWQKIANCVPDKSKQECLLRYKYLCEIVQSHRRPKESDGEWKEEGSPVSNNEARNEEDKIPCDSLKKDEKQIADEEVCDTTASVIDTGEQFPKRRSRRHDKKKRRDLDSEEDTDEANLHENPPSELT